MFWWVVTKGAYIMVARLPAFEVVMMMTKRMFSICATWIFFRKPGNVYLCFRLWGDTTLSVLLLLSFHSRFLCQLSWLPALSHGCTWFSEGANMVDPLVGLAAMLCVDGARVLLKGMQPLWDHEYNLYILLFKCNTTNMLHREINLLTTISSWCFLILSSFLNSWEHQVWKRNHKRIKGNTCNTTNMLQPNQSCDL